MIAALRTSVTCSTKSVEAGCTAAAAAEAAQLTRRAAAAAGAAFPAPRAAATAAAKRSGVEQRTSGTAAAALNRSTEDGALARACPRSGAGCSASVAAMEREARVLAALSWRRGHELAFRRGRPGQRACPRDFGRVRCSDVVFCCWMSDTRSAWAASQRHLLGAMKRQRRQCKALPWCKASEPTREERTVE